MTATPTPKRLPRSLRIHLRRQKAHLRSTLAPEEAEKAIRQLVRSIRARGGEPGRADG